MPVEDSNRAFDIQSIASCQIDERAKGMVETHGVEPLNVRTVYHRLTAAADPQLTSPNIGVRGWGRTIYHSLIGRGPHRSDSRTFFASSTRA